MNELGACKQPQDHCARPGERIYRAVVSFGETPWCLRRGMWDDLVPARSTLNCCLERDKWVLTNLSQEWQYFNALIPQSHELWPLFTHDCIAVQLRHAWLHSCIYDTLYHSRRNDRDREYECDRGISPIGDEGFLCRMCDRHCWRYRVVVKVACVYGRDLSKDWRVTSSCLWGIWSIHARSQRPTGRLYDWFDDLDILW